MLSAEPVLRPPLAYMASLIHWAESDCNCIWLSVPQLCLKSFNLALLIRLSRSHWSQAHDIASSSSSRSQTMRKRIHMMEKPTRSTATLLFTVLVLSMPTSDDARTHHQMKEESVALAHCGRTEAAAINGLDFIVRQTWLGELFNHPGNTAVIGLHSRRLISC